MDTPEEKPQEQDVHAAFLELLNKLTLAKPNDRSSRDRYWAITITEVEKAYAVFQTFAAAQE